MQPTKSPLPAVIAASAALIFAACELVNNESEFFDPTLPTIIRYSVSVQPILDSTCVSCHGAATAEAGLRLDSWSNVTRGSTLGEAVIPFRADRSRMIRMIERLDPPHPADAGGDSLSAADLATLKQWIDAGARDDDRVVPNADASDLLYVTDPEDASIAIVDRSTNNVIRMIDLVEHGFPPSARPASVAVEPDGSAWYVSLVGANTIAKFNRANVLVGQLDFTAPGPIVIHPDADLMYVARSRTVTNPPLSVGKIVRSTLALTEIPVLFPRPHALGIRPDGNAVLVGSYGQNRFTRIEVETDSVSFLDVPGPAHALFLSDVSEVTGRMITTGALSGSLLVFDLSDADTTALVDSVPLNASPTQPRFTPDGQAAYVPSASTNSVARVTFNPLEVQRVVVGDGLAQPDGSVLTSDGRFLYVANRNPAGAGEYLPRHPFDGIRTGTVVVIDTATDEIVRVIEVGTSAAGVAARDS